MLVYGDRARRVACQRALADVRRLLREAAGAPPEIARHAALVSAFIAVAELAQGIADHAFEARGGVDEDDSSTRAAISALLPLATVIGTSWEGGFADTPVPDLAALDVLAAQALPTELTLKEGEGYAFYALYPEAYWAAARAAAGMLGRRTRVIGLRSIGTGLAAMVAAALGAAPPVTLRPQGHPFDRQVVVGDTLAAALLTDPDARYAVVDEGPGLSGSSFASVIRWLSRQGVGPERIHLFPSHAGGPGSAARDEIRRLWEGCPRHVVGFEDLVLATPQPGHRLEHWFADVTGPATAPLRDLAGGRWRAELGLAEEVWPPSAAHQERRAFLLQTESGPVRLKFVGLGAGPAGKLAFARRLAAAGFVPEPLALRHGFLAERWIAGARPLWPVPAGGSERSAVLARLGGYLGHRAKAFAGRRSADAEAGRGEAAALPDAELLTGATDTELTSMAVRNVGLAFGEAAGRAVGERLAALFAEAAPPRPVPIDGRLHAWEWLRAAGGALYKADALDHHAAHDLIGCQDIVWDVAGAVLEFDMTRSETDALIAAIDAGTGRRVDPARLAAFNLCYAAFQLGAFTLAAEALAGWPEEAARLRREVARYRAALAPRLGLPPRSDRGVGDPVAGQPVQDDL